ncbi:MULTISPECIES: BCCT family transporter [Thalassospira]|jgi:BCCT family betaine/carnitine transporter|uniref:BCCT transporter n=2 Tax=Thalassospira tepidiphila TaxID=393657 RepID=A0A853KZP9_9PROT|nr:MULTISPECIES: BCCT family transporter [Thalassospira]EKF08586.1 choline/carnitine/betaine transporter [Thalassospira profundimaris WP0211]KZC98654.1 BCCT transporter [Thalassospira sp. MCCC 1A02898]MBE69768.1 BCCT family transporter [Thalassospira sp.]MBO6578449.1 BCCT family transporter [Thalassospira sp.]MBO6818675.1 BCCT family transporter [Thalassospira sp.]
MGSEADTGIESPDGAANPIDTEYEIGQDNIQAEIGPFGLDVHNPVFLISGLAIVAFVFLTLAFQESVGPMFNDLRGWLTSSLDWFFLSAANVFVVLCLFLIVSPLGRVRLGGADATPDYSYAGWFAMLFAAGMGIGLMFYGVSEPISHFTSSMGGIAVGEDGLRTDWAPLGAAAGDADAAFDLGMAATIFHWGLHPWAIYATVALALALFSFNKGLPLTIRSIFYPIFGERVWGWTGHLIDILAVFATLFGLATSLGFGAEQANAGLDYLFGISVSDTSKVFLIVGITGVALISVLAGLDAGVKRLSEINMILAALLLLFVVLVGPTMEIITGFFSSLLSYAQYLPALSNPVGREDANFSQGWTSFYWAWWISWSPFVGMFIARVSRGRTVREFITCVLIIPSLVCVLWMTAFGGTAVHMVTEGVTAIAEAGLPIKLFTMLDQLPLQAITSFIGIVLVIVFFVTSSDSGSLVIDTITAGGKVDAPVPQRVFWCTFEGLVAIALLLGGGLGSLQAMAVSTGFPFAIVLLMACYSIIQGLRTEPKAVGANSEATVSKD